MNMLDDVWISRLLDIAYAGCHKGCVAEARTIYERVLLLKPGHVPALIGLGFSHLVVGEHERAEAILRAVLSEHADDADARCMLGLCLAMQKKEEGLALLSSLKEREDATGRLADNLLKDFCKV